MNVVPWIGICAASFLTATCPAADGPQSPADPPDPILLRNTPLEYIDTSFENASPLWYEIDSEGMVQIHLNYDHERNSPNRAAGHIHFQLWAKAGAKFAMEFRNLQNIYNGRPGS